VTRPPARRRPPWLAAIFGGLAAVAVLLVLGPFAAAVVILGSGPEIAGPGLAAKVVAGLLVLALAAAAGLIVYVAARLLGRLFRPASGRSREDTIPGGPPGFPSK
jgi:hypothetical protein